jgi:hypothetical protein
LEFCETENFGVYDEWCFGGTEIFGMYDEQKFSVPCDLRAFLGSTTSALINALQH